MLKIITESDNNFSTLHCTEGFWLAEQIKYQLDNSPVSLAIPVKETCLIDTSFIDLKMLTFQSPAIGL